MGSIGTVKEDQRYKAKPYSAHILLNSARYPETIGRFKDCDQAIEAIKARDEKVVLVSEYRFEKEATAF